MSKDPLGLTIGALADAAGVNVETIRFYQRRKLLDQPQRQPGEIRRYRPGDVARVQFVKAAQRLGFSLEEIASLLKLDDGSHCDDARVMAEQKLSDVRSRMFSLRRMEVVLEGLIADCCAAKDTVACPLIAALHSGGGSLPDRT